MKSVFVGLLLSTTVLLSGCSSLFYTTSNDSMCGIVSGVGNKCSEEKYKTYIGTRKNFENIKDTDWPERLLFIVDIPLSAIVDTLFLVYTVPRDLISQR